MGRLMAFANASIQSFFMILSPRLETLIFLMFAVVIIETLVFLRYERRIMKSFLAAITCNGISFLWGSLLLPIPDLIIDLPRSATYEVTTRSYRQNPMIMNDLAQYFSPEYLSIHQSVLFLSPNIFTVLRISPERDQHILTLTNVTNKACDIEIPLSELSVTETHWCDIVTGKEWIFKDQKLHITLDPYDVIWLEALHKK